MNISERRNRVLCQEGRIEGVIKVLKTGLISINSNETIDKRYKCENKFF